MVSIKGLKLESVVIGLYNEAEPYGLGIVHYKPQTMTEGEAKSILKSLEVVNDRIILDYINGRRIKALINLKDNYIDEKWYDDMYGEGKAQKIIDKLRGKNEEI